MAWFIHHCRYCNVKDCVELRRVIELLGNLKISTMAHIFRISSGHTGKLLFLSNGIASYSCKINLLAQILSPPKTRDRWRNTKKHSDFHGSDGSWNSTIQGSYIALYLLISQGTSLYISTALIIKHITDPLGQVHLFTFFQLQ